MVFSKVLDTSRETLLLTSHLRVGAVETSKSSAAGHVSRGYNAVRRGPTIFSVSPERESQVFGVGPW